MEIIKTGRVFDFMKYSRTAGMISAALVVLSIVSFFVPGPNLGIDFAGGTELQLQFRGDVPVAELRATIEELGYPGPDVIQVQGHANQYLIRVNEVSTLPENVTEESVQTALAAAVPVEVLDLRFSEGHDRVTFQLSGDADLAAARQAIAAAGVDPRGEVRRFGPESDFRYELELAGVADHLVEQLQARLGERGPEAPLRIEWVGPRAGRQLQEGAIKALLYAMGLIMLYVAMRFDLRFAPGGIVALLHDGTITAGALVLLGREFNLTTIASLLTIIGYSINDTIVIFDRIRENMARHRDKDLAQLVNISTSEMLGRTMITSGVTLLAILPFFVFGTQTIFDIALALFIGFLAGVYSTIFIASPLTVWMDTQFFAKAREARKQALRAQRAAEKKAAAATATATAD